MGAHALVLRIWDIQIQMWGKEKEVERNESALCIIQLAWVAFNTVIHVRRLILAASFLEIQANPCRFRFNIEEKDLVLRSPAHKLEESSSWLFRPVQSLSNKLFNTVNEMRGSLNIPWSSHTILNVFIWNLKQFRRWARARALLARLWIKCMSFPPWFTSFSS